MRRTLVTTALLAVCVHALWALGLPLPVDWDPQYYRAVARHLLSGEGASSGALWTWMHAPQTLPGPADLHWMPLPSRVLVPALWLWPAHGDQLLTVLFGAAWAPLAAWLAARLDGRHAAWLAGLFAASGWFWVRFLSTPDSVALYGLVGGLAFAALVAGRGGWVTALSAVAALVRSDGFLLGPCLALGLRGRWRWAAAAAGPAVQLGWSLRNRWVFGEDALTARLVSLHAASYEDLLLARTDWLPLAERLGLFVEQIPVAYGFFWCVLLPLPAAVELWLRRRERWALPIAAYAVALPSISHVLAPAVAASGTLFRSGAALGPVVFALWGAGVWRLGRWSQARRGYPALFLPGVLLASLWSATVALGLQRQVADPDPLADCDAVAELPADVVLLASDPLALEACDRPAVLLPAAASPAEVAAWVTRYDIAWALVAPQQESTRWWASQATDVPRQLPGWEPVGERLFRAPR